MIEKKLSVLDIESILNLENGFLDGWNYNQLKSAFDSGRFFVIGMIDNDILIGFVSFSIAIDQADIETVFVKGDYRRQGIAKALIESAQNQMQENGVKKVFLEVREGNLPARSLYSSLGFSDISVRKKYYPDGENAVIMAKELL